MAVILRRPFNRPTYYAERWGLQSYWNLQDLTDAYGGRTLTNTNGVTFTAGKIGNSATFNVASSQVLTRASEAGFNIGNDSAWVAAWVNLSTIGTDRYIISKGSQWALRYQNGANRFRWFANPDDAVNADTLGAPTLATWYFLFAYTDRSSRTIGISGNGGSYNTTTSNRQSSDGSADFNVGGQNSALTWDGQIALCAFGKAPPAGMASVRDEIRDTLYAAGTGRLWPF